jgi:type II secretory pathway pseudopilin PulG
MKKNNDAGSTTIEALVALLILSIAGAALVAGTSGGIAAAVRAQGAAKDATTVLRLDDAVRRAALRVRLPYWDRSAVASAVAEAGAAAGAGALTVPWFDGVADETLRLSIEGETLKVESGGTTTIFSGMQNTAAKFITEKDDSVKGIDLRCEIGGRQVHIVAPFGAVPMAKETP